MRKPSARQLWWLAILALFLYVAYLALRSGVEGFPGP